MNAMRTRAESPLEAFATESEQDFRFDAFVPHVPLPIFPVTTLKLKARNTPEPVMVTGCNVLRSQPD